MAAQPKRRVREVSGHRYRDPEIQRSSDPEDTEIPRCEPDDRLGLVEYTREVFLYTRQTYEKSTSTPSPGRWRSKTWDFVRWMKRHAELGNLGGSKARKIIPWGETDFSDADRVAIQDEWDRCVFPAGVYPLEMAAALADQEPLWQSDSPLLDRFLSIAGHLQRLVGQETPIKLPCREVGKMLGVGRQTVSHLRRIAIRDGHLEVAEPHVPNRRATKFYSLLERQDDDDLPF